MMATTDVAKHYAKLLNYVADKQDTDPKDIHLIGHSLGAHISGFAGRRVQRGKVGRITGNLYYNLLSLNDIHKVFSE